MRSIAKANIIPDLREWLGKIGVRIIGYIETPTGLTLLVREDLETVARYTVTYE